MQNQLNLENLKEPLKKTLAANIKNESKNFYAYVSSKQKVRDKVGPLENNRGNISSEGFQMVEVLNEYLSVYHRRYQLTSSSTY